MANIYKSITELVGRTPILEVSNIEKELNLEARILVKLEYFNPAGSVKDLSLIHICADDMLVIRGVNVFPSQIEEVLLRIEEIGPHYEILVERKNRLDVMTIRCV